MKNNLVEKTKNLPTPAPTEQLYRRVRQLTKSGTIESLEEGKALLTEMETLARPATKAEIAQHLAIMLKAFPNSGNADREAFVRILAEDVGASQPSLGVLDVACRKLRRTARFMPTINETLEALVEATEERRQIFYTLGHHQPKRECWADQMLPENRGNFI
jgi:hypothetical protein